MSVVIIDDLQQVRDMVRLALEVDGRFTVLDEGCDGREAVALCALHRPDIVVLDVMMPTMDGILATPQIKEVSPHTKVVVFSSRCIDQAERHALDGGADLYVEKHRVSDLGDLLVSLTEQPA